MITLDFTLNNLPESPGCYLMKNKDGKIIYIGKAKNLKNRVRQYFQQNQHRALKVSLMVKQIEDIELIITSSETEALILECNLIKCHKPHYNVLLKDDKHYPFIKITMDQRYPKISMVRKKENDKSVYLGPYPSAHIVLEVIRLIKNSFKIQHCNKIFPRDIDKERPCLYYSLNQCCAPCSSMLKEEEYYSIFQSVCDFLNDDNKKLIAALTSKMQAFSDNLDFEAAASLRDRIISLGKISEKQQIISSKTNNADVFCILSQDEFLVITVLFVRGGKVLGKDSYFFNSFMDELSSMTDFLVQYYSGSDFIPSEIYLNIDLDDLSLCQFLSEKRGGAVKILRPQRGDKHKLLLIAMNNARLDLDSYVLSRLKLKKEDKPLLELASLLKLSEIPKRIECFDVSNTSGQLNVCSMIVLTDGKFDKSQYRKYNIKSVEGANDYMCLKEALTRRFDNKDTALPDLLFVDGGTGHLNIAMEVLSQKGVLVPAFGLVKDDKHRTRGIVSPLGEVHINPLSQAFYFITRIQDEVHRFALSFHKKKRSKKMVKSVLDDIPGIGQVRKNQLLRYFKSVDKIKNASVDELCKVKGMNVNAALNVFTFFNP